jgi:hypothetical protein
MGRSNKFDYQAAIETCLIAHPEGLSLDQLVEHSGLQVDRSTLFRHLTHLIESGRVERIGKARASRYRPLNPARSVPDPEPSHIPPPAVQRAPKFLESHLPEAPSFQPPSEVHQASEINRAGPEDVSSRTPQHEAVVKKAVRTIVRDWKRCNRVNLEIYLSLLVKPEQVDEIGAEVEKELAGLRADDLDRFGLTLADFDRFVPPDASVAFRR